MHRIGPVAAPNECAAGPMEVIAARADFSVVFPDDPVANRSNLSWVEQCPWDEVRMHFETGVDIVLDNNQHLQNPVKTWEGLAQQSPMTTTVGVVDGTAASLTDPAGDPGWC